MRPKLAHQTTGYQKHALAAEIFHEFSAGDHVMTVDGVAGKIAAVSDGPYPQTETYEVVLDGGAGGGAYSAGQLRKLTNTTPTAGLLGDSVEDFGPAVATTTHMATEDYPELGDILHERPPNERVQVFASRTAGNNLNAADEDADDRSVTNLSAGSDAEQVRQTKQEEADARGIPAVEQIDPPSACSFCGSTDFEEPTNTGRGTRMRCTQCGGTMTSWGGQWQPEMPNSPENAASRQGDFRSTINDLSAVHAALEPHELISNAETMYGTDRAQWSNAALRKADKHGDETARAELAKRQGSLDPETLWHFTATWADVRRKAKRIKNEGGVRIVAATHEGITGEVQGDHGLYESAFTYVPGRKVIAAWDCGCKWGAYAWGRAPAYARFEGRQCSHVTALQYEAQSRGMFGAEVYVDPDRLEGQHQRSPVTVQYQRPTERHPGGDQNRRSVPPGNMRSEWHERSRVRTKGSLEDAEEYGITTVGGYESGTDDLAPVHVFARQMAEHNDDEDAILTMLAGYGVAPAQGLSVLAWAVDAATKKAEPEEATADPMGGQAAPGTDIPRLDERDQTDAKHKRKHVVHHTNDSRKYAPNFGYGIAPGVGPLLWCDQCNGSGCGHCGGTGQVVAPGGSPTGGAGVGDLSMTTSPVGDQGMDAGDAVSGDGLSATGAREYPCQCCQGKGEHSCGHECYACDASGHQREQHSELCDPGNHHDDVDGDWKDDVYPSRRGDIGMAPTAGLQIHEALLQVYGDYSSAGDMMTGNPSQNYMAPTPHSNSNNPGSTGWGTSADPTNWEQPLVGQDFGSSWHSAAKSEGAPGDPPTVSGVALKAADTGRVLMIQRSNKDEKDPARGTWEFPGGHHEDGDQTSLHAGIREWQEETGHPFPEGGHVSHTWRSGPYQGHVVVIPKEEAVDFSNGRATTNPDDPDGDDHEQSAWWEIEHAKKNPALRPELKDANPWSGIAKAAAYLTVDEVRAAARAEEQRTGKTSEQLLREHVAWQESQFPGFGQHVMDEYDRTRAMATLHDEPEPALPSTDGADDMPNQSVDAMDSNPSSGLLDEAPGQYRSAQPKTPWGYAPGDPNLGGQAQPQAPEAPPEGDAGHDMLADDTTSNAPFRSESGLEGAQSAAEIVAAFQATAAGQALKDPTPSTSDGSPRRFQGSGGGEFSDGDIAENMRRVLAGDLTAIDKTAAKDFSFSEQQELIMEGGSRTRARNFGDLDVEGTHYARLGDEIVEDDEFLML
jgi:8-oxo-dGTP pyrophosphatase MutT (NUDIX family)